MTGIVKASARPLVDYRFDEKLERSSSKWGAEFVDY
jgi:hypothetical protein